jgi:predicted glycoside hydrolase/deacetylase ChbG (UPF0249 family)
VEDSLLIINADDWGGWRSATDAALRCAQEQRISSATAMVFMEDSERAASAAREHNVSTGLHLNFNQLFTSPDVPKKVREAQARTTAYLRRHKWSQLLYNPVLDRDFDFVCHAQLEEFTRLYERAPTHCDGHQHMHLCSNMLLQKPLAKGTKVRTTFSFTPGEKSLLNRLYRSLIVFSLRRKYTIADFFFSLRHCLRDSARLERVARLAQSFTVELMCHPEVSEEQDFLLSPKWRELFGQTALGTYANL